MMVNIKITLHAIGMAALLLCAIGNALLSEWGSAALALLCAFHLLS